MSLLIVSPVIQLFLNKDIRCCSVFTKDISGKNRFYLLKVISLLLNTLAKQKKRKEIAARLTELLKEIIPKTVFIKLTFKDSSRKNGLT